MRRPLWISLLGLGMSLACLPPLDTASNVKDLRVLGIQLEPPELMSPSCSSLLDISVLAQDVRLTALIADPKGNGRSLHYDLRACANQDDAKCTNPSEGVPFESRDTTDPEPVFTLAHLGLTPLPGASLPAPLPDGGIPPGKFLLLQSVFADDPNLGLGGLLMPVMLHVKAGSEEIYAQKLMAFTCKRFSGQTANVTPVLPGLTLQGSAWDTGTDAGVHGSGPFAVAPVDFHALEEAYEVPSVALQPVHLTESWRLSYYADMGKFSPEVTGGTSFSGGTADTAAKWQPDDHAPAQDVHFWVVVRDGRGGLSWLERTVAYAP